MKHKITVQYEGKPAYDIMLEPDYNNLNNAIKALDMENRKFMIVTDSNVNSFYLKEISNQLLQIAGSVKQFVFPAGEQSKKLDTVSRCYEQLMIGGFDRNDVLVALGGGVTGDLTGFAAATYLRGMRFIQLPTSLLAMVDSSIGGKTGVDFQAYKNMVGAFHQPKLVYINISTLLSLPEPEFFSGMGEIIKHGLIKDKAYYLWLKENEADICNRKYDILREMIEWSCRIKQSVVEQDPKELGERALLNFGHTIGHSVEKLKNLTLLHGECVSIGMAAAAIISYNRGNISKEELKEIKDTIQRFHEPVSVNGLSADEIYEITKMDKKMDSNQIKFILLKELGDAVIDKSVTKEEMLAAIHSILE